MLCRESYIFYLRRDRVVGVEYRKVESTGRGAYRQVEDAVGEIPTAASSST